MKQKTGYYVLLASAALLLVCAILFFGGSNRFASEMSGTVYIDEILSSNHSYPNELGFCSDFIELHNESSVEVSLSGYGLTDSEKQVRYVFPQDAVIAPGGYLTVWCDADSTDSDYAKMSISREKSERIFFVSPKGETLQTVDTIPCQPDQSMVLSNGQWSLSDFASPGFENTVLGFAQYVSARQSRQGSVIFSEVLPSNSLYYNEDHVACDWIEFRNLSVSDVSLDGFSITDGSGACLYRFPAGSVISAGGYYVLYCSEQYSGQQYAPFSVSKSKRETYVLRDPGGKPTDYLFTDVCEENISLIPCSDGSWVCTARPTPGYPNDEDGFAAYLTASGYTGCAVRITEIMSRNAATIASGSSFPDWIELTNLSESEADLENWYLTDGEDPFGWQIHDMVLAPGETRLLFCGSGGIGFSLSSHGETLRLCTPMGETADSVTYPAQEPDQSYMLDFSTGQWTTTLYPTPGFPNDPGGYAAFCASRTPQGPLIISELQTVNDTYYKYGYQEYYDWLELRNISGEAVLLSDYYLSDDGKEPAMYRLPDVTLQPGACFTVLCIGDESKSDYRYTCTNFSLNAAGETLYIFDADGMIVDYTSIPPVPAKSSFGRLESGGFGYFSTPTPGSPNASGSSMIAREPVCLTAGGIYNDLTDGLDVSLSADGTIYYTTDGSIPTVGSRQYTEPIHLTKTTVIRAIATQDGMLTSSVMTESFFLNENHTLPILSLVSPRDGLFSAESGIYVSGNYVNYYQDWERAANLALYEQGKEGASFNIDCGLKMFGAGSRECCAKKSFKVLFNGRYEGKLQYDVFEDGIVTDFYTLGLRAGEDYRFGLIRDTLFEELAMQGCPTLMTQNCRPVILYIDGEYWGIYTIKERFSQEYYASHMNFDPESVTVYRAPMGSTPLHNIMIQSTYANMRNDDWLNEVMESVDIYSMIDWVIMEAYAGNSDISGNIRYIYSTEDGKWRWCLFDLDWSYYSSGSFSTVLQQNMQYSLLPRSLLQNKTFRKMFCQRLAQLCRTTLSAENVTAVIDYYAALLQPEVQRDHNRWGLSYRNWENYVENMRKLTNDHDRCKELINSLCLIAGISDAEKHEYFGDLVD